MPAAGVTAEATPFYAQPDGQRCLVRFLVSGLDAPAGRLRAYDRARRQLGTAGMLPRGDGRLYGELWLPLTAVGRVQTELAAPGLTRPVVTWHTLTPAPRWTLHWVTLLDPEHFAHTLASLEALPRAALTAALQKLGAGVNPAPAQFLLESGDVPFLRLVEPALALAAETGVTTGAVAAATSTLLSVPTVAAVLAGSGVGSLVLLDAAAGRGLSRREAPDGSRLLVVQLPPGADPESLGFLQGGDRMTQAVERFLAAAVGASPGGDTGPVALVVGREGPELAQAVTVVQEWNARFTYPRVVVGDPAGFVRAATRSYGERISVWSPEPRSSLGMPSLEEVTNLAAARARERTRRATVMIECLAPNLQAIANQLAMAVPGTLVFNPTSYARTELARMADGSERLVTDIPPLGYAYFPLGQVDGVGWRPMVDDGSPLIIQTPQFRVVLDSDTGAIRSLVTPADGVEWAQEPLGINSITDARLLEARREILPGVASRMIAERQSPVAGAIRSVVTVYEHLPWVDIVNHADAAGAEPVGYRFGFATETGEVEWEIPGGTDRAALPCDFGHLRWVRCMGERGAVLLAALEPARGSADETGAITSYGPRSDSHYRIGVSRSAALSALDDPWRFGWGIEPLVTAPVPGTGGATLPSFGSLLLIDQPGIVVVGMQPARDGNGVIVYLQELLGRARVATLGGGLIGFEDARLVDLVERDLGSPPMVMRNGLGVMLAARGVAAVRLLGA